MADVSISTTYTSSDMVEVNGTYYHSEYLADNNIVELYDGEYEELDNTVCIDGDYYLHDDERVVYCDDTEDYALRDDVWQCFITDKWYASDDPIRLCCIDSQDELTVHKDEIDNYESDIASYDPIIDACLFQVEGE
jgi:hypothetical protein